MVNPRRCTYLGLHCRAARIQEDNDPIAIHIQMNARTFPELVKEATSSVIVSINHMFEGFLGTGFQHSKRQILDSTIKSSLLPLSRRPTNARGFVPRRWLALRYPVLFPLDPSEVGAAQSSGAKLVLVIRPRARLSETSFQP